MSDDIEIYKHALSNVNFMKTEDGFLLFLFNLFEVNTSDVRFYLSNKEGENKNEKALIFVPPSDQTIRVSLTDELYEDLKNEKVIKIYEIDWVTGKAMRSYRAYK
tara:strand:+ start:8380 stop:8694 length:315 start_codon:yes stop_codon:yes gene_type:complete